MVLRVGQDGCRSSIPTPSMVLNFLIFTNCILENLSSRLGVMLKSENVNQSH